jgi:hypothetical protein
MKCDGCEWEGTPRRKTTHAKSNGVTRICVAYYCGHCGMTLEVLPI